MNSSAIIPIFLTLLMTFVGFTASKPAVAQTAKFQNIKEQSIKIKDVPKPEESIVPKTLSKNAKLPRIPKLETLRNAREMVKKNVFLIHVRENRSAAFNDTHHSPPDMQSGSKLKRALF